MSYIVEATFTVSVANPATVAAVGAVGGQSGDERSQVQAAANAGLAELQMIARRYGFEISDSSARVRAE
jgi:hypothetical protein